MTYAECRPGKGQPSDGDDQSHAGEVSSEGNRVTRLPVRSLVLRSVSAVRTWRGAGRAGAQALSRLANATYGVPVRVEITGSDARMVDDAMQWVRCQHAEYRQAEAAGWIGVCGLPTVFPL